MKGHVRKRGKKWCFILDVGVDPNTGKRQQKWFSGFLTKKEAEKAMTKKLNEINSGTYVEPSKLTFEEFCHQWVDHYARSNCGELTLQGYEYIINQHFIPSLGKVRIDDLKTMYIQKYYIDKLRNGRIDGKGGLSAQTVLHHHRLLHEILEFAVKWNIIETNPTDNATPPKVEKKEMNTLTKSEIKLVLDQAKGKPFYHVAFLAIHTGMRRGEIFGLKWEDIDFENGTLRVRRTLKRIKKIGLQLRNNTKTSKSRRTIAITESVIQMFKQIQHQQKKDKLALGSAYHDQGLVFANQEGNFLNMDNLTRNFCRMVQKLDVPYIRFHDLRHCHATILMMEGIHPKVVSERLGHSSTKLTMDTYSHVSPNMQK